MSTASHRQLEERTGHPAPPELATLRKRMHAAAQAGVWATEPPAETRAIAGVRSLRFGVRNPRAVVIHFHGGGYRLGRPEAMGPYARALADRCGVEVVCPEYRLAPEHPFPAALIDGLAVSAALAETEHVPLILSGDSAGGGLAASLTAMMLAKGGRPAGLVLHSPWLDLTASAGTYGANAASDGLFSREAARAAADFYLQGHPADDPLASPGWAALDGFPPTLITVGTGEVLLDDARSLAKRLAEAQISVRLVEIGDMEHTAVTRGLDLPGAAGAFDATADFVRKLVRG